MKKSRKRLLYVLVVILGLFAIILGSFCVANNLAWVSVIVSGFLILFTVPVIVEAIFPD